MGSCQAGRGKPVICRVVGIALGIVKIPKIVIGAGVGGGLGALAGGTLGAVGGSMVGDAAQLTLDDLKAFGIRPDPNIPLNAPWQ